MNWNTLLSPYREYRDYSRSDIRNAFQRDYDRIIFSNIFRRLQNKTQVFPLPGSKMVHNRLTHSLEVASVGRSIARIVSKKLSEKYGSNILQEIFDIDTIVSAACLAHDLGNPPFGHSGEETISSYFKEGPGKDLEDKMPYYQWTDLINFEGNANAFRQLTHKFAGRRQGGMSLTYATLATLIKYPYPSYNNKNKKKYNFFYSEKETFRKVMQGCNIPCLDEKSLYYARHPLSYMMEAADDICYQIMDIEDAHKLKILTTEETKSLLLSFFNAKDKDMINSRMSMLEDTNEQIVYLRSCVINCLENECVQVFVRNESAILSGKFEGCLIRHISDLPRRAYELCEQTAVSKIYHCKEVVDIEIAGFQVMLALVDMMVHAVTHSNKVFSQLLINRVSPQYDIKAPTLYGRLMAVLDYISGMTDVYAMDLYRKINGMSIPTL